MTGDEPRPFGESQRDPPHEDDPLQPWHVMPTLSKAAQEIIVFHITKGVGWQGRDIRRRR